MTTRHDAYWDDLGVAWSAINPEIEVILPRLKQRLRRQSILITIGLVTGLPLSIAGLALGALTIWIGGFTGAWNFITRGVAIVVISLMLGRALTSLLPVRASDACRSLSAMLELAIGRTQRTVVVVRLGLYSCLVAAVFGLAGTAIRTYLTGPPRLSPVIDLSILALFALALFFYGRHMKVAVAKMQALKHALDHSDSK